MAKTLRSNFLIEDDVTKEYNRLSDVEKEKLSERFGITTDELAIAAAGRNNDIVMTTSSQINQIKNVTKDTKREFLNESFNVFQENFTRTSSLADDSLTPKDIQIRSELLTRRLSRAINYDEEELEQEFEDTRDRFSTKEKKDIAKAKKISSIRYIDPESSYIIERHAQYMFGDMIAFITGTGDLIFYFNENIRRMSVNMSIDTTPGSFTIEVMNPVEYYIDDFGQYIFQSGDMIRIYATRRFADGPRYKHIFWGMIETIDESFSGATASLTLSGADVSVWFEYTRVIESPGLKHVYQVPHVDPTAYTTKYAGMSIIEILLDIILNEWQDFSTISGFFVGELASTRQTRQTKVLNRQREANRKELAKLEKQLDNGEISQRAFDSQKAHLDSTYQGISSQIDSVNVSSTRDKTIEYWKQLFINELQFKIFGFTGIVQNIETLPFNKSPNGNSDKNYHKATKEQANEYREVVAAATGLIAKEMTVTETEKSSGFSSSPTEKSENGTPTHITKSIAITDEDRNLGAKAIYGFIPFPRTIGQSIGSFHGEDNSKLDVINRIKDLCMWEFFVDMDGSMVFKPPFYNQPLKGNEVSKGPFTDKFEEEKVELEKIEAYGKYWEYVLHEEDLITFTIREDSKILKTRYEVTGEFTEVATSNGNEFIMWGAAQENELIKRYGLRYGSTSRQRMITDSKSALLAAKAIMDRINSGFLTASVTIIGRPELHLGKTCYFPSRDTIFYIQGITHDLQAGGQYTTTLALTAGRRRMIDEKGEPLKYIFDGELEAKAFVKEAPKLFSSMINSSKDSYKKFNANKNKENIPQEDIEKLNQVAIDLKKSKALLDKYRLNKEFLEQVETARKSDPPDIRPFLLHSKGMGGVIPTRIITDGQGRRLFGVLPYGARAIAKYYDKAVKAISKDINKVYKDNPEQLEEIYNTIAKEDLKNHEIIPRISEELNKILKSNKSKAND